MIPGTRSVDGGELAAIARAIAYREVLWRPIVRHDPSRRWFMRSYRTPEVEAWLLTWTVTQAIELHDHGGSAGAMLVVEGELLEVIADPAVPSRVVSVRRPHLSLHTFGPMHIHGLTNLGPGPATSIHVYSPPLSQMTYYDREAPDLTPLRVEGVEAESEVQVAR